MQGNKVYANLTFSGTGIAIAGNTFRFAMNNIRNPNSTAPSSPFSIETYSAPTSGWRKLMKYSATTTRITTTTPGNLDSP